jgi:hypothetical protein
VHDSIADEVEARLDDNFDKLLDLGDVLLVSFLLEELGDVVHPRSNEDFPSKLLGLHVNHTTSRDSGRGGDKQVHGLEHHGHVLSHGNLLSVGKAELLVIIKHCVHGFNPDGIDRPVEDQPSAVLGVHDGKVSVPDGENTIRPISGDFIESSIKLGKRDTLGVNDLDLNGAFSHESLLGQYSKGVGKDFLIHGLSGEGLSNHHESMTHQDHLVELNNLL